MISRGVVAAMLLVPIGCYEGLHDGGGGLSAGEGGDGADGADGADGGADDDDAGDDGDAEPPENADEIGRTGLRRLTSREYDATLADLLYDETAASNLLLPEDPRTPFDNAYADQNPSLALIEGAELLASDAAARLVADPAKRDLVVGCTPTGPDDAECFDSFVASFGRRAFRRPLTEDEHAGLTSLIDDAIERDDFYVGVESVIRAALQSPSFLYRVEIGTQVEGDAELFKLNDYELATRMSYFLWGTTPDDVLLDHAEAGDLDDPDSLREVAIEMLEDPRALELVTTFHALWMGYENLPHEYDLAIAMKAETSALMQRVIFDEKRPWQDLLRLEETFVDTTLAEHYGLPVPPSGEGWVTYEDPERKGLLAHGSFLSLGGAHGDTSPTQRGLLIRTRLFCEDVPPPPPDLDVNVDDPPGDPETQCKSERYAAHQVQGNSCYGCHQLIDPIGFGLERYDQAGLYREFEPDRPECPIEGIGEIVGVGTFQGPASLADLMVEAPQLNRCVVTMLYRFAMGRYELEPLDGNFIDGMLDEVGSDDFRLDELLIDFVASDAFRFRRLEES